MAKTLEELLAEYQNGKAYTPLTQEQMQQKAATRYDSAYNQKLLSAQQGYETSDQALAQQLAGLQATYDKQREQSRENYAQAASQADRQALGRGMQRSSYNNATVSNINLKGAKAQQEIADAQAAQTANLNEQRTLLAKQLADTKAGLEVAKQSDILAYMDELEAREYERQLADSQYRNQLAMQLYEYQYKQDQDALAQQNWQTQFEHQKGQDALAQQNWQTQLDYQKAQDALAQQNWQTQLDYQKAQDALAQQNWLKEFEAAMAGSGGSSGGSSGGGSPDNSSKNSSGLWAALGSGVVNAVKSVSKNATGGTGNVAATANKIAAGLKKKTK